MERVDQITEVRTKPLNDGRTLYLIFDSKATEFSTTKRELAQVAQQAVANGAFAQLDYIVKTNDRGFTNHYLNGISLLPDDQPTLGPGLEAALSQAQAAQIAAGREEPPRPSGLFDDAAPEALAHRDPGTEKDLAIAKAVGLKAGVEVLQYLPPEQRTVSNVVTAAEFFTRWLVSWRP
jgi:hypothetical protein